MTETEKRIILFANQMGYTPIRKQARAIWDEWELLLAAVRVNVGKVKAKSDETQNRTLEQAIRKVMEPPPVPPAPPPKPPAISTIVPQPIPPPPPLTATALADRIGTKRSQSLKALADTIRALSDADRATVDAILAIPGKRKK